MAALLGFRLLYLAVLREWGHLSVSHKRAVQPAVLHVVQSFGNTGVNNAALRRSVFVFVGH